MVNVQRMAEEFVELVKIDSLSKNERWMADTLKARLEALGLEPYEDDAGEKIGGSAGNIICRVEGESSRIPILLMAHMDTVVPGIGKTPLIEGDVIKTDGRTVLGGDDAAGIECILEAIRVIREHKAAHGDIYIVFTAAEECGLLGSKNLDYSRIPARYGFVLDGTGPIGSVAVKAPSQNRIDVTLGGRAAHAGLEPEKGISAIQMASEAISRMRLGRIDEETTANIGVINGGQATNIVCDHVEIKAEARSRNEDKLDAQTRHMKECFEEAAFKFGGTVQFKAEREYPAYNIGEDDDIIRILRNAAGNVGVELILEATGGGSDTNIINGKGIKGVDISVGMDKVHSVEEQIRISDMTKAARFVAEIIKESAKMKD